MSQENYERIEHNTHLYHKLLHDWHKSVFTNPPILKILGNYYSLKFEREKAISYFKRALQVNRNCLTAWTLMGHEYVELKNTHAAVVAYKRALGKSFFEGIKEYICVS